MKKITLIITSFFLFIVFSARTQVISTIAGNGTKGYSGDSIAAALCEFNSPSGLFMSSAGNLYVGDDSNGRVRMINAAGIITTVAGNGTLGYSGDGFAATNAQMNEPWKVVLDRTGNMYISDVWNQVIRKVDTSGIITTYAGMHGIGAYAGDGGPATAAYLNHPVGIAVDKYGNLYIGDVVNNVIRKINTSGIISTVAGNASLGAGSSGDGGPATAAQLYLPYGVTVDTLGNMYIADAGNNKIRMVDTSGVISTIAGIGSIGYSGDGSLATLATLSHPFDLATDGKGNIYISDVNNNCIRKINTLGIITTIAGNDTAGYSGDGGPATMAKLNYPCGITLDTADNIYIADEINNRVRKIYYPPSIPTATPGLTPANSLSIFPNPSNGTFTLQSATILDNATLEIFNIAGEKVFSALMNGADMQVSISQPSGVYLLYVKTRDTIYRQKFSIMPE